MNRRTFLAAAAVLSVIVLAALSAALPSALLPGNTAYAQANNAPQFPASETGTRTVDENTPWYQNIGDPVTATDPDDDELTYSLENARTSPFTIDTFSGQLQTGASLDYETKSSYTVKVIAADPSGETVWTTVTINVNNVEEPGKVSLSWKQPQVDTALEATLSDPDEVAGTPAWTWARADAKSGAYTDISGAMSPSYTPVAGDVGYYLRATATYSDGEGSGTTKTAQAASAKSVRTPPPDNRAPVFEVHTGGGYSCDGLDSGTADICLYVRRSAPAGSDIYYPARATDPDRDEVHYSLEGTDAASFNIVPSTGVLLTTEAHAYDDPGADGKFEITIIATDPSRLSDRIDVELRPSGSSGAPVVKGPEDITYPENGTWPLATYSATAFNSDHEIGGWMISVRPGGGDGDFFRIDGNGVLTFIQPPDYEDPADENGDNTYSFSILAYDTNPPSGRRPGQTFISVTVTVADVDEPLEVRGPTAVDYAENRTDAVATYTARNADGPVTWSLSGDDAGKFSISNSGELSFNTPPDYEDPTDADGENDYLLSITIAETGGDEAKIESVRVAVTDVNEPPEFPSESTIRSVGENTGVHEDFGDPVTATDPDGDGLTYTLEDAANLPFSIGSYSGQFQVEAGLDHETQPSYTVTVSVRDGKDAEGDSDNNPDDTITVTINVTAENEAPVFPAGPHTRAIAENTAASEIIGLPVAATDADRDSLTYTLGGADAESFTIVPSSGQLQTKAALDYENRDSYNVTVTATDPENASATVDVAITVTNVDEAGTVTLSQSQPSVRAEITATLTDPDGSVTGETWSWERSMDKNAWDPITGAASNAHTPVDGDVAYYLRAAASYADGHGPNKNVQAVSDNAVQAGANRPPEFGADTATREVPENTAAGGNVGDPVVARDPDDGDTLTYSLGGADAGPFTIDSGTGQIRVGTGTTLDHEATKNSYTVTVSVHDGKGDDGSPSAAVDDTITVTITVTDENDPPQITGDTTFSYPENGTDSVHTYTATDPESGSITWSLTGDDAGDFSISNTGELTFRASPDHEAPADTGANNIYEVTVQASDGTHTGSLPVTVTVTNVNEPPVFAKDTDTRTIAENTEAGQNIGDAFTATDDDSATLTYTLEGADADSFQIISTTGQIQTKPGVTYDHETKPSYSVTVKADDSNGGTDTIDVTINVTDVNEAPEFPSTETGARSIPENTETNTNIGGPVEATDPDVGDTLTYALGGTDARSFDIDTSTGQLQTKAALDLETTPSYTVTVTASDGSLSNTQEVTITVTGENETPEVAGETTVNYAENREDAVAEYTATDPEKATIQWSLTGDDAGDFSISGGALTFNSPPDYEAPADADTNNVYRVTVTASDGSLSDAVDVTITVTDANEAPEFPPTEDGARTVPENTEAGEDIGDAFTATDDDSAMLTYTLEGADADSFQIISTTGQIKTKPGVTYDHETKPSYSVAVKADDSDGGSDTIDVTITVTDVNEAPEFPSTETGARSIPENTETNTNIGDPVEATDPDVGDTLIYTLDSAGSQSFSIVPSTGQLQTKAALDKETKDSYTVTVSVHDGKGDDGSPSAAVDDTITVTITVTDENDPPQITGDTTFSYPENGTDSVHTYTATDPESGSITWSLTGDDGGDFSISNTGELTFRETPNFEAPADANTDNVYLVTVQASDGTNTVPENLTVAVTDVNEPPEFPPTEDGARTVPENTEVGEDIGAPVSATDPDAGATLTYTLSGTDALSFTIDESTGQIKVGDGTTLDHEAIKNSYTVTVSVSDGTPDASADDTIAVTITVIDVYEAPTATGDTTFSYPENGAVAVHTYTATDLERATVVWSLSGEDSRVFSVTEGVLAFKESPDFEEPEDVGTVNVYSVTVTVSDGSLSSEVDVTITVTNVDEPGKVTLNLLQPQVDTGLTTIVTDPDGGVRGMTWKWEGSSDKTGWATINGAVSGTYIPVAADVGNYLRVTVTYTDGEGSGKTAQVVSQMPVQAAPSSN